MFRGMDIRIINAALTSTGNNPIPSENDGSAPWRIASANYDIIVDAELEKVPWSFARKIETMTSRSDGDFGYEDAFTAAGDFLTVRRLRLGTDEGCDIENWDEADGIVYCDASGGPVWMEYTYQAPSNKWSKLFTKGVRQRLEALFLRAINEEDTEARNRDGMADQTFMDAARISTRRRSPRPAFKQNLSSARRRRG